MFEKFIHMVRPGSSWTHEMASIQIFQQIYEKHKGVFQKYGLDEQDITFIKVGLMMYHFTTNYYKDHFQEIIFGPLDGASVCPDQPWPYKGRGQSKAFLFEIVANKSCSIDVDKV